MMSKQSEYLPPKVEMVVDILCDAILTLSDPTKIVVDDPEEEDLY